MDIDGRIEGPQFPLVRSQKLGVEIADIDCLGAIARELVRARSPDAEGGICS